MNDFETADGRFIVDPFGHPIRGTFPRHWGRPPDELRDRERWIQRNIAEGEQRMNRGERVEGQRPRTGRQALASLRTRSANPETVHEINRLRLRLLDLRERRL